jgi:hypothetical protein
MGILVTIFKRKSTWVVKTPGKSVKSLSFLDDIEAISFCLNNDYTIEKITMNNNSFSLKEYKSLFPEKFI